MTTLQAPTVDLVAVNIPGHGRYAASAAAVDVTLAEFLPASAEQLRERVVERAGFEDGDWDDVKSVTTLVVVLAATSGFDERVYGAAFD